MGKEILKRQEARKSSWTPIHFVEGGCEDIMPEERRCVDVEELTQEAQKYFEHVKGLLIFDIERILNHFIYAFVEHDLLRDMEMKMRAKIKDVGDITEMVGGTDPNGRTGCWSLVFSAARLQRTRRLSMQGERGSGQGPKRCWLRIFYLIIFVDT